MTAVAWAGEYVLRSDKFMAFQFTSTVLADVDRSSEVPEWVEALMWSNQSDIPANVIVPTFSVTPTFTPPDPVSDGQTVDSVVYDVHMSDEVHRIEADDWIVLDQDGNLDAYSSARFSAMFKWNDTLPNLLDSEASDTAGLVTDFNLLLTALKVYGYMDPDPIA